MSRSSEKILPSRKPSKFKSMKSSRVSVQIPSMVSKLLYSWTDKRHAVHVIATIKLICQNDKRALARIYLSITPLIYLSAVLEIKNANMSWVELKVARPHSCRKLSDATSTEFADTSTMWRAHLPREKEHGTLE